MTNWYKIQKYKTNFAIKDECFVYWFYVHFATSASISERKFSNRMYTNCCVKENRIKRPLKCCWNWYICYFIYIYVHSWYRLYRKYYLSKECKHFKWNIVTCNNTCLNLAKIYKLALTILIIFWYLYSNFLHFYRSFLKYFQSWKVILWYRFCRPFDIKV